MAYTQTGTTAKSYINGKDATKGAMSLSIPHVVYSASYLGNIETAAFNGGLGPMQFYTDDADPREVASNFQNQADRFRATPVGDIITRGLMFHLDPANADACKEMNIFRASTKSAKTPSLMLC